MTAKARLVVLFLLLLLLSASPSPSAAILRGYSFLSYDVSDADEPLTCPCVLSFTGDAPLVQSATVTSSIPPPFPPSTS